MVRLDDVDIEFIEVIINILEFYKLNKLSIMLCNRYNLMDRIGHNFIRIASRYSNLNNIKY